MDSQGKRLKKEERFRVEILHNGDKKTIFQLICLEEKCFPLEMRNADSYKYYSELLKNSRNINILLKYKNRIVGLMVAKEYEKVFNSLANHDPDLRKKRKYLYVDLLQIHPRFRLNGGLMLLISKMVEQAVKKRAKGICIHARRKNGLSEILQKMWGGKKQHSIDNWLGFREQFDYLETDIDVKSKQKFIGLA